jgi:hypothetical protein
LVLTAGKLYATTRYGGFAGEGAIFALSLATAGQAAETIAWANPAPIVYGTALDFDQLDATASVAGSFAYSPASGTVLDTGANTLSVTFTPADTADYSSTTDTVSLLVLPASLTVTAANATRIYGQTNPVFGGTITGIQNGDNITPVFACGANATSPPGAYAITVGLLDSDLRLVNYTVTTNAGVLTIVGPTMSVVHPPGGVGFAWPATVGLSYKVQFTTNLFQPRWTDLGAPIPATNSSATVLEAIEPGQGRFYRLVIGP